MWKVLSSVQVLVCVLLLCACSADPRFESAPTITANPVESVPLVSRKPELMEPTDGGRIRDSEGHFADFGSDRTFSARIVEVTHTEEPEVVFDVAVEGRSRDEGWVVPEQPLPQSLSLGRRMSHLVPLV